MTGKPRSRGLVDTNVVIHLPLLDVFDLPDDIVICAVTLAELSAGPHHTDDPAEKARRINVLQHTEAAFDPLPFDANAARAFGRISAAVLAAGRHPRRRLADLMIASVAAAAKLPLFTTNPTDFQGLDDLITIHPVARPTGA